jgi:hypothetical protein
VSLRTITSHKYHTPCLLQDGNVGIGDRLRVAPQPGQRPVFHFTLDDLDELVGSIAAEANHAKNKVLQEQLDQLCDCMESALSKYTGADV